MLLAITVGSATCTRSIALPEPCTQTHDTAGFRPIDAVADHALRLSLPEQLDEVDAYASGNQEYDVFNRREWRADGWTIRYAEGYAIQPLASELFDEQRECVDNVGDASARIQLGRLTESAAEQWPYVVEIVWPPDAPQDENVYAYQVVASVRDASDLQTALAALRTARIERSR